MTRQDRHDLYLCGLIDGADAERYETLISRRPDLAAELQARLAAEGPWEVERVRRARALLAVTEAFFNANESSGLDLLTVAQSRLGEREEVRRLVMRLVIQATTAGCEAVEVRCEGNQYVITTVRGGEATTLERGAGRLHRPLVDELRRLAGLAGGPGLGEEWGVWGVMRDGVRYRCTATFLTTRDGETVHLVVTPT